MKLKDFFSSFLFTLVTLIAIQLIFLCYQYKYYIYIYFFFFNTDNYSVQGGLEDGILAAPKGSEQRLRGVKSHPIRV